MDLSVQIGSLRLKNPVMSASGCFGYGLEYAGVVDLATLPAGGRVMIYACGPEAMLAAVGRLAARFGQPSELAMERQMGCGVGGCYSCVVRVRTADGGSRFARSCIEGPVFKGDDILWD